MPTAAATRGISIKGPTTDMVSKSAPVGTGTREGGLAGSARVTLHETKSVPSQMAGGVGRRADSIFLLSGCDATSSDLLLLRTCNGGHLKLGSG